MASCPEPRTRRRRPRPPRAAEAGRIQALAGDRRGCRIRGDDRGRGGASEAAGGILDSVVRQLALTRVIARCLVRNPPSARIITRLGLRHVERRSPGTVESDRPEDVGVYAMTRDEYGVRGARP